MLKGTTLLFGLYTITPLHVGTGQAVGAVDLPIAREQSTGIPCIPATTLKGVVRDVMEATPASKENKEKIILLLGPDMKDQDGLKAGGLIFTEAQCLAIPFRSLNCPYVYVTSHLILERFERNLRAFHYSETAANFSLKDLDSQRTYVTDMNITKETLVIEDIIIPPSQLFFHNTIIKLARTLGKFLPIDETSTRKRLENNLVILPDQLFTGLVRRGLPVQARIKLTANKTTAETTLEDGSQEKGNLWYEETVPADSMFAFFILNRPGAATQKDPDPANIFATQLNKKEMDLSLVQMGGNETVGQGWCWCTRINKGLSGIQSITGEIS
ncbi:MAG: type III-B CRISPR module RAMP protein Cmr4 [Desulfobacterium sp.]